MKKIQYILAAETVCAVSALILSCIHKSIYMIVISAVLLILCVIQFYFQKQQERISRYLTAQLKKKESFASDEKDMQIRELESAYRSAQYSSLQSQINPHFLYNTLDSIRSKALMEGQSEIAAMAEKLAVFFRYCISSRGQLVRIREELSHISDYYDIQKFRFGDRFTMEIFLEDEQTADYYIPRMTLQPVVENALHHGIEKISRKGRIEIHIILSDDTVEITVSDNGAGMDAEEVAKLNERMEKMLTNPQGKRNGIALANTNKRIKLTFGQEYGIRYRSMKDVGTDAVILIPAVDDFARVNYESRGE